MSVANTKSKKKVTALGSLAIFSKKKTFLVGSGTRFYYTFKLGTIVGWVRPVYFLVRYITFIIITDRK